MVLKVDNIKFYYNEGDVVFNDVSFQVKPQEIVSIVGPSGTGKSTLLKCIAGHLDLKNGQILIEGERVLGPSEKLIAGHPDIALVNQLFELDNFFTVKENISNQLHHLSRQVREEFTHELLEIFELNELADVKSKDISGGEQQRLTMACALAKEPRCLLLDEPFVHLDVHLSKKIGNYIRKLANLRNMAVVLVTHNGAEALSWSDKIIFMNDGQFKSVSTPEAAYNKPRTLYQGRFFGELNSVYFDEKQYLFRPNNYSLEQEEGREEVEVKWIYSLFKGPFYANYFKLDNGREIVLYANKELNTIQKVYV